MCVPLFHALLLCKKGRVSRKETGWEALGDPTEHRQWPGLGWQWGEEEVEVFRICSGARMSKFCLNC